MAIGRYGRFLHESYRRPFLNRKMRDRLTGNKSDDEILGALRKPTLLTKMKKWPQEILGREIPLAKETLDLLCGFNDMRGDLTHPKTSGHDIYKKLEVIEPMDVIRSVADFVATFHQVEGTRYPYWLFGWNYLNPRSGSYEIVLINDQQFSHSLRALGLNVPTGYGSEEAWKDRYLGSFQGYLQIDAALAKVTRCEPKWDRAPFKPVLCNRWWQPEHHKTCGNITADALEFARNFGK